MNAPPAKARIIITAMTNVFALEVMR